ncbi:MAG: hypothetical protein U0354_01120 [Candidatus Sericytochromatia bacterium]
MKKISYLLLSSLLIYSCATPSTNNVSNKQENTKSIKDNTLVNKPIDNNDPLVSKPTTNKDTNTLVNKPIDNNDPLVSKPTTNKDPNTLVSKPTDNNDPLVSKPIDNSDPNNLINTTEQIIDPNKVNFTKSKGFNQINFNEGNYEVNLNVDLTEFSIFRVLANSDKQNTSYLDINVKIDKRYNNKFKVDKDDFINENNLTINIKGLKLSSNLYVDISAKDSNNKTIVQKELINEQIKDNKSINSSLFKNTNSNQNTTSSTNNSSTQNSTSNTSTQSSNPNNINNTTPETPKPTPTNTGKKDK